MRVGVPSQRSRARLVRKVALSVLRGRNAEGAGACRSRARSPTASGPSGTVAFIHGALQRRHVCALRIGTLRSLGSASFTPQMRLSMTERWAMPQTTTLETRSLVITSRHGNVPQFHALVPLIHVVSVLRSITFYETLGFRTVDVFTPPEQPEPSYASVGSGGARLMLVRGRAIIPDEQGLILTLYCEDVRAMHAALKGVGVAVRELTFPSERPNGRFRLKDPDGYDLAVTHA